jgi:hypothetical protein
VRRSDLNRLRVPYLGLYVISHFGVYPRLVLVATFRQHCTRHLEGESCGRRKLPCICISDSGSFPLDSTKLHTSTLTSMVRMYVCISGRSLLPPHSPCGWRLKCMPKQWNNSNTRRSCISKAEITKPVLHTCIFSVRREM